jgi:hypothetical protein
VRKLTQSLQPTGAAVPSSIAGHTNPPAVEGGYFFTLAGMRSVMCRRAMPLVSLKGRGPI